MRRPIVRVRNLSKQFVLRSSGSESGPPDTLKEALTAAARAPLRRWRERARPETLWALKDVSFDVMPGEIIGIVGPNGAGKSTLLKILSRILEPTSGRVELYGRTASLLEIGTGFHPDLSGRENVYLNGAILGMTRREIDARFDEIVEFAGVGRFLEIPVKRYSSGMHVRLAFAVAAHLDPEILILDEVLAVGDIGFQKKCLGKFDEATRSGRTVLLVSHSLATVTELCERAILLWGGQIRHAGPTAEVVDCYRAICDGGPSVIR
jgi:homopolymeric O-antigen transport system ATP-binding protein